VLTRKKKQLELCAKRRNHWEKKLGGGSIRRFKLRELGFANREKGGGERKRKEKKGKLAGTESFGKTRKELKS